MASGETLPRGVYAALVSPLDDSGQINAHALKALVNLLSDAGVDGFCPVGSAGEGPLLGPERRADLVDIVSKHVAIGLPVVPAVCHTHLESATDELRRFADLGATAALITPPPFYAFASDDLIRYFHTVADKTPLPLLLYDIPQFAGVQLGVPVITELAAHDNIVGLKDSTADEANLRAILETTRSHSFGVYAGSEPLFATAASLGAAGVIGGSVNVAPTLVTAVWQAAFAGDPGADALQAQLTELAQACRAVGRPFGWKAATAELGRCTHQYCAPVTAPSPTTLSHLRSALPVGS